MGEGCAYPVTRTVPTAMAAVGVVRGFTWEKGMRGWVLSRECLKLAGADSMRGELRIEEGRPRRKRRQHLKSDDVRGETVGVILGHLLGTCHLLHIYQARGVETPKLVSRIRPCGVLWTHGLHVAIGAHRVGEGEKHRAVEVRYCPLAGLRWRGK